MQACNSHASLSSSGWSPAELAVLARFPLVAFEKCTGIMTPGSYTEDKIIASCVALKQVNPHTCCTMYLNLEKDFSGYRVFDSFEAHPEWWMHTPNGTIAQTEAPNWGCRNGVCPGGNGSGKGEVKVPDYSVKGPAQLWMGACANATAHPAVDGCSLDKADHLGFDRNLPGTWAPRQGASEFYSRKLVALLDLQKSIGDGVIFANCHGCFTANSTIPGNVDQNLEHFGPDEASILALQVAARADKQVKAHFFSKDSVLANGTRYNCCNDPGCVVHAMAAFLIGAGKGAWFACGGFTGVDPKTGDAEKWLAWLPEYDKPLGAPVTEGTKDGSTGEWHRSFARGTRVTFSSATNKGTIVWAAQR
jgi:hypothetical protein